MNFAEKKKLQFFCFENHNSVTIFFKVKKLRSVVGDKKFKKFQSISVPKIFSYRFSSQHDL